MVATPNLMCAASNPTMIQLCTQIVDETSCLNAKKTTKAPILSFCKWEGSECHVNADVGGGNGVVTLPAPGGGDSGGPFWVLKGGVYVHVGLLMGGSELHPRWAIASQTDYMQDWLLAALDRDTCITGSSLDYFDGYSAGATGLHPSATTEFQGGLASSTNFGDLSLLPVRASASQPPPPPSPPSPPGTTQSPPPPPPSPPPPSPSPPPGTTTTPPPPSPPPPQPTPSSPSPPPSTETVVLTMTASGSVADYADTSSLRQNIADAAGVDAALVTVSIAAASVIITASIAVPASTTAAAVQTSLSSSLASAATASAALGITVQATPSVAIASPPPPPPPSMPPPESSSSSGGVDGGMIGGIVGGSSGLLFGVLGGSAYYFSRRKKRGVAPVEM